MGLQQLKKQLKRELIQQELRTKKSKRKRWFFLFLLLLFAGLAYPVCRQQQITAPQRLLSQGIKDESLGQLTLAEKSYREIYNKHPDAPEAAEALLKIARIEQFDFQDDQKALLNYLLLEHDYPESSLVLPAREAAAQIIKYSLHDYSRAIEFYQRLLELGNGTPDRYRYEIADCYFRRKNYQQARIELETLLEKHPDSPLVADALYRRGGLFLLEGDGAAARRDWHRLIESYPASQYRFMAEFELGRQLEEEGLFAEALHHYQRLAAEKKTLLLSDKITHLQQQIAKKKGAL